MDKPITEQLLDVAAQHFKIDRATLNASTDFFQALNINSLQALSLLSKLETSFGVEIPDYELIDVRTFAQLAELIETRL